MIGSIVLVLLGLSTTCKGAGGPGVAEKMFKNICCSPGLVDVCSNIKPPFMKRAHDNLMKSKCCVDPKDESKTLPEAECLDLACKKKPDDKRYNDCIAFIRSRKAQRDEEIKNLQPPEKEQYPLYKECVDKEHKLNDAVKVGV